MNTFREGFQLVVQLAELQVRVVRDVRRTPAVLGMRRCQINRLHRRIQLHLSTQSRHQHDGILRRQVNAQPPVLLDDALGLLERERLDSHGSWSPLRFSE